VRVVLIYDKLIRPDTTGTHCEAALRTLGVDVVHHAPLVINDGKPALRGWEELPAGDLYVQIDDDIAYPTPAFNAPSAYWCIDVHRMDQMYGGPLTRWQKMQPFGRVFSAQKDMAVKLRIPWLPLAYDPGVMFPIDGCAKVFDWCFIGNFVGPERMAVIERLRAAVPNAFVGQAYGPDMNRIYNQSRVAVNYSVGNDVNMRFFEVQATGTPLLSNRPNNGEDELFDQVLYYESPEELPRQLMKLLESPEELAGAGRRQLNQVSGSHTYVARMKQLLEMCGMPWKG